MISNRNNHWFALFSPCVDFAIGRRLNQLPKQPQKTFDAGFIRRSGTVLALCALLFSWSTASGAAAPRQDQVLTDGWKFIKDDAGLTAAPDAWQSVTIPHTWNTKSDDAGGSQRRSSFQDRATTGALAGMRDPSTSPPTGRANASSSDSRPRRWSPKTYLNGQLLGEHRGGFTAFCYELTPSLHFGGHERFARAGR